MDFHYHPRPLQPNRSDYVIDRRLAEPDDTPGFSAEDPTLEALTHGLEPLAARDPLDRFLTGKRDLLAHSAQELLSLIYEREALRDTNLRRIAYDASQTRTRIMRFDHFEGYFSSHIERLKSGLEKDITGLERERRFEEVACWRDTTRLRTELRDILHQFSSEQRKANLLQGMTAALPNAYGLPGYPLR